MSIEVNAYVSGGPSLSASGLLQRLHAKGWAAQFVDEATYLTLPDGDLRECLAFAWPSGSPSAEAIRAALEARDQKAIGDLFVADEITCCAVVLRERADFVDGLEDSHVRAEIQSSRDAKAIQEALAASTTCFTCVTSAGRNRDAAFWQELLCMAIASARGGVFEDPHFGTFRLVPPSVEIPDPAPPPAWRMIKSLAGMCVDYLRFRLGR